MEGKRHGDDGGKQGTTGYTAANKCTPGGMGLGWSAAVVSSAWGEGAVALALRAGAEDEELVASGAAAGRSFGNTKTANISSHYT